MPAQLPDFQRYQLAFTAHLRDPDQEAIPTGVSAEGMAVYEEIVFNNLFESIGTCFPVARKVLGKRIWQRLVRAFMRDHAANSPLFRHIPEQFLHFLMHANAALLDELPPYTHNLCHYEWIELCVASSMETAFSEKVNPTGNLAERRPVFTSTLQLLHYDYPVHKISPHHIPSEPHSTQLLVYLNTQDTVKFIEINAVTYQLLTLLKHHVLSGKQALTLLAQEIPHLAPQHVMEFGLQTLQMLREQGIIIGTID